MGYGFNVARSARRHFRAAENLYQSEEAGPQSGNRAVAGYLYGLSGELAVKEMMRDSGMRPLPDEERNGDPFYKHFPHLKTLLRDAARGRRAGELRTLAERSRLFQYWDTDMRYAPTTDVKDEWVSAWRDDAKALIEKMDL
jgi:hypothetical protein